MNKLTERGNAPIDTPKLVVWWALEDLAFPIFDLGFEPDDAASADGVGAGEFSGVHTAIDRRGVEAGLGADFFDGQEASRGGGGLSSR